VVGMGGIFLDPRGKIEASFTWGLGVSMNNQAEAYALLQGHCLAIESGLKNLILIGNLSSNDALTIFLLLQQDNFHYSLLIKISL
jgi:hypothetical protein